MPCENLEQELNALLEVRREISQQLHIETDPSERVRLINELKQVGNSIGFKKIQLEICLEQGGQTPLTTRLVGSFVLRTTFASAPGPFEGEVEVGLRFSASRTAVTIASFPMIVVGPFDTPFGENFTTVRQMGASAGTFDIQSGSVAASLNLRFDHSIDLPFFEEDSTFPILLTTGSVADLQGSPLNRATRQLSVVGIGTFNGGIMDGSRGDLVVSGTLDVLP